MGPWFKRFFTDPEFFVAVATSLWSTRARVTGLIRAGIIAVALGFANGTIPTGVSGLGPKVGAGFAIIAAFITAGEKNATARRPPSRARP